MRPRNPVEDRSVEALPSSLRQTASQPGGADRRIVALDGVRGLMTILVVVSHYFGEVPHGISFFLLGRMAVETFFVLSGFLVGGLVLDKMHNDNFFQVFYVRRVCRTLPIYFFSVIAITAALAMTSATWRDADVHFPLWSYFTFTQNFFMAETHSVGAHWLSPSWTLAIEEQFYVLAPLTFLLVPRRYLIATLLVAAAAAVGCRIAVYGFGFANQSAAHVLLPTNADVLICGLLAALAARLSIVREGTLDYALRLAPIVLLLCLAFLGVLAGRRGSAFAVLYPLLTATAAAAFLLSLARGAPEAQRFRSRVLCFFGRTSYAVYLTHLPILGLMHGLFLGARPDIVTSAQWLVTLASLPLCVMAGWVLTKLVEEPITAFGRTWTWSGVPRRGRPLGTIAAGAPQP
jgi:peptidoglycan/LPS O-acetylase OafA/YrhL